MKLSAGKRTFPGRKQVWRVTDGGFATHDVIGLDGETAQDGRPLLVPALREGRRVLPEIPLREMQARSGQRLAQLPAARRALDGGSPYPVRISGELDALTRSVLSRVAGHGGPQRHRDHGERTEEMK
jgi:nicotinate phosphoribosyltransferase